MEILYINTEYAEELVRIGRNLSTYYAWGAFGAPATVKNKNRYKVPMSLPPDAFLFDCSGFAYKALPWGWCADSARTYGGATYRKIPELETNNILALCSDVSTDFNNIMVGEVLYMPGHVGIYIGKGRAIECTSKWSCGVLTSEVKNCKIETGLQYKRTWKKHGKLPFISYEIGEDKPEIKYRKYEVKRGDTLGKIAREYLGSFSRYDEIMRINGLTSTVIYPKQILWLPAGKENL